MSKIRQRPYRSLLGALVLSLAAASAGAVQHEVRILLDLDDDAATGCDVSTVAGVFAGAEQILISTVETTTPPDAGTVTDVALADCIDEVADTFGTPASFDGGWPVGVGGGVGGRDVVETYAPLLSLVIQDPSLVHLGVVVTDELGGEQALLTVDGTPDGDPILLGLASPIEIPTLGEWGLMLLSLLLAAASLRLMGRGGAVALGLVLLLLATGVAWAAGSLDGLTDDWAPGDQLASNGIVLFGRAAGGELCFRVDLDLSFNSAPAAEPDAFVTDEDTPLAGANVLADNGSGADSDPDSDPFTVTDFDPVSAQGAAVTVAAGGDLAYDPTGAPALQALDDGDSVDDTFTYTIEDTGGASDTATVTVTVGGVNDAPTAMDDTFETDEDVPLSVPIPGVLVNDADVDTGDTLTAVLDVGPSNADSFTLNPDGSFSYTPALDFNGTDSFTYHASDGAADSPTVTATIMVGPVNDGPNAVDDAFVTDEDTPLAIADPGVLTNDTDPELDPLTVTAFDAVSAQGATVSVDPGGGFTHDPTGSAALQALAPGETAVDTFTYTVEDPGGASDTATVTVTVTGVDDPPVAVDDTATVNEDSGPNSIDVLLNDTDVDGGARLIAGASDPDNGMVVIAGDQLSLTYEPDPADCNDGVTTDDFTYTLSPGGDVGLVQVTVVCINDAPMVTSPIAYAAVGNTLLRVDGATDGVSDGTGHDTALPGRVASTTDSTDAFQKAAPTDVDSPPANLRFQAGTFVTTQSGSLTLDDDGDFVYDPPTGFTGPDDVAVNVEDQAGGVTPVTIQITVSEVVWYVEDTVDGDKNPALGGTGESTDPFETLAAAEAASGPGAYILVFETDGPLDEGITLQSGQRLYGQPVGGLGTPILPGGMLLEPIDDTGARPVIDFTGGDAVTVAATGASLLDVEIRHLELSGSGNAIDVTSADPHAVGVTITENLFVDSGAEAIDLNPDSGGAFTATTENNSFSTASPTGNAIDLVTTANAGDVEVAINGNTDITSAGIGIRLDGSLGAGTLFVTGFADNTVHGNTAGAGVMVTDVTFDADPSDADFDEVAAGTWSVGDGSNPVGGAGVYLGTAALEVEGHLSFDQLDVFAGNGAGLDVAGAGLFGGGSPGTGFRLEAAAGAIEAAGGSAVDVALATAALTLGSITSTGSPTIGVSLVDVAGTFSAATGSITGAAGTSFNVGGGTPAVTYDGAITHASNGTRTVEIQGMAGGSASFGGAISATDGTGIRIASNTGTNPISFTGTVDLGTSGSRLSDGTALSMTGNSSGTSVTAADVDVFTSGQTAVVASGSGLLDIDALSISTVTNGRAIDLDGIRSLVSVDSVACSHNSNCVDLTNLAAPSTTTFAGATLSCTTGTCFNASSAGTVEVTGASSTISAPNAVGLNLTSTTIGAGDVTFQSISASGAANGIVLNGTGTSGGLVVTGDGSNTNNASGGTIQNTSDHGIVATDTQDLSLTSIRIQNPGDAPSEHGILATGLRGANLLRASTITEFDQASGDGFRVINNSVNLTELRIDNSTFSASDGNDGLAVFAQGTSVINVVVENQSLFTDLEGDALDILAGDLVGSTATVNLTVDDNDFTNAGATGNGGIQARAGNDGNLTGSITNNTFNDTHRLASTAGVIEIQGNNTGSVNLTVSGNDLDTFNQSGINVGADDASDVVAVISGNSIDTNQADRIGIRASIRNTGMSRLTIQNNQVGQTTALPGIVGTRSAIDIEVFDDSGSTDDVRILIDNNQLRVNKTSSSSEVLDFFINDNADAHLTVTNNTLTNLGSGDGAEIVVDTAATTLCLDLRSNTAANPGPTTGNIELVELAGTYSVENLANVVANNPNASIVFDPNMAAFSNAASCLTP